MSATPFAEVIGDPVAHSKSPAIHKFWLEALGLSGDYRRELVKPAELAQYLDARRHRQDWRGCSVTLPHKIAILDLLDELDSSAERVGAVNTVVRRGARLVGYNSDAPGFAEPLVKRLLTTARAPEHLATYIQVIGAGGSARAVVSGALMAGFTHFEFFNRTVEKARDLAFTFDLSNSYAGPIEAIAPLEEKSAQHYSHVIVNATSMGMGGSGSPPVDLRPYPADTIVYDLVYSPLLTPLVEQARRLGLETVDGLEMLVAQAAVAFQLFYGHAAPRQHDARLRELLTR